MILGAGASPGAGGSAPDGGRAEVALPAVPGLGGLYARGVGASVRLAARARLGRAGAALPAVTYVARGVTADADRLSAYQHLLGEPGTDALPAGFVHVLAFPVATALMVRPDFPLPLAGMVHLANAVEQHRQVRLGESLDVRAHAEGLRAHRSGTQVDLVTEVAVAGEPVWRGVSTYLAKGVRLDDAAGADGGDGGRDAGSRDAGSGDAGPPDAGPLDGGAGGTDGGGTSGEPAGREAFAPPTPTGIWSLPADVGRRYAAVSGDRNPIHLSALTARPLGFPRAIAHGMYTASRALATVGPARGPAFTWTARFAKPVLLPGTVAVRVAPADSGAGFAYAAWSRSGALHLTGAVLPR